MPRIRRWPKRYDRQGESFYNFFHCMTKYRVTLRHFEEKPFSRILVIERWYIKVNFNLKIILPKRWPHIGNKCYIIHSRTKKSKFLNFKKMTVYYQSMVNYDSGDIQFYINPKMLPRINVSWKMYFSALPKSCPGLNNGNHWSDRAENVMARINGHDNPLYEV